MPAKFVTLVNTAVFAYRQIVAQFVNVATPIMRVNSVKKVRKFIHIKNCIAITVCVKKAVLWLNPHSEKQKSMREDS